LQKRSPESALAKYALEPAHEATFHSRSYGFRPGRSAHDAQKILFLNLSSKAHGIDKRVLELDIEKCFDRISHSTIMEKLIASKGTKIGIFRSLKKGINPEYPEQGTPQGGVVSPLLANIALNGIEEIHQSIRYADDMVFILKPQDNAEAILEKICQFLAHRGMKVSEKKTQLTRTTDGFDFLGWHFKVQANGKFRSTPSKDNFKTFRRKAKNIINHSNYGATAKAQKLGPVVRGWRNYHRYCKLDGPRFSLESIRHRAYAVFNKEARQNRYTSRDLIKKAFPAVGYSENRYICVAGDRSPFDGDLIYWSKRNSKLYDGSTSKALKRQNHTCGHCGLKALSEERIHLHHIDGNHDNWKIGNLLAVHESCHDYIHMSKTKVENIGSRMR
jgi:RNA-directed DNA polymerase